MPKASSRYQRYSDCLTSLETSLQTLVDQARLDGWTSNEIAAALVNFAVDVVPDTRRKAEVAPTKPSAAVH